MKRLGRWVAAVVIGIGCVGGASAQEGEGREVKKQEAKVFEKEIPVKLEYLLSLPEGYGKEEGKAWPLILFLHGSGERGSDVNKVKVHGPPKLIEQGKALPFIVVSPQCPSGQNWRAFELNALLEDVMGRYKVDPDRVYLTGLSMGGYGTWDLAGQYGSKFAAIAPICGGGNVANARRMRALPTWVFHGDADPTVPVKLSDDMVAALKAANATEVKYTRYPGVKHDSWTETYNNPELYEWFLSHKRGDRSERGDRRGDRGQRRDREERGERPAGAEGERRP